MQSNSIKYAISTYTGKLMFINDVRNGIKCDCKCVACDERLIAVQGSKYEKHFRHDSDSNCGGGKETILHLRAKQIILENNQILIRGGKIKYTNAIVEKHLENIRPDVTVQIDDELMYIEIAVTNPKNNQEKEFFVNNRYKCIEIDLQNVAYDLPYEDLKKTGA